MLSSGFIRSGEIEILECCTKAFTDTERSELDEGTEMIEYDEDRWVLAECLVPLADEKLERLVQRIEKGLPLGVFPV